MSEPNQKDQAPRPETAYPATTGYWEKDEGVSLTDLIIGLYRYRIPIATVVMAVAVLYMIVSFYLFLSMPVHRTVTLPFRLDFEGVDRGEYPNGIKFSSAEIVATPILTKVFEENNLQQYLTVKPTFPISTSDPCSSDLPVTNNQNLSSLQPRNKCWSSYFG